jgi:glycosyltransferase involved in cell wall biosynthesis
MPFTVLSVFDVAPRKIGGVETLAAELSRQINALGGRSVLAFCEKPTPAVTEFFAGCGAEILAVPEISARGLPAALAFFSLVRRTQAGQVHLSFTSFLSPVAWACRAGGARRVYFTDQTSRECGEVPAAVSSYKQWAASLLASAYDRVFCVSGYVHRQNARRGYVRPDRLTTLYNSVDFRRIADERRGLAFRRKFAIGANKILIVQVSCLRPEKGLTDFIHAAALALAQDSRLHFLIAGEGPSRDEYLQLCGKLGIANSVTFTGLVEDPMGEGLFAAADIACQFSRWQEAFAWVIAEAMAHRKPVIATQVGGIPEVIEDGVTGRLIPPADPPAGAKCILELSRDKALRVSMGNAGYDRAWKHFNLKDHVACLLSAYGVLQVLALPDKVAAVKA